MRLFILLAIFAAMLVPLSVRAADDMDGGSCGTTAREALAAADRALGTDGADAEKRALVCLLRAVKLLAAEELVVKRGSDNHDLLHAPMNSGGPGKKQ